MANNSLPRCKPLRVIEWMATTFCLVLLFFLKNIIASVDHGLNESEIIFLFVTFGSLSVVNLSDVVTQLFKFPTNNAGMIFFALLGSILTLAAAIILLVEYQMYMANNDKRTLSVLGVLTFGSFFSSIIYIVDAMILIRFFSYARLLSAN